MKFQQRFDRGMSRSWHLTRMGNPRMTRPVSFPAQVIRTFHRTATILAAERGRSSFDIRHRFSTSFSAELPWGTGRRGSAEFRRDLRPSSRIWSYRASSPSTRAVPSPWLFCRSSITAIRADRRSVSVPTIVRILTGDAKLDSPSADRWFDTAAFAVPAYGTFGNSGRNILDGPGYQNVNLGLAQAHHPLK